MRDDGTTRAQRMTKQYARARAAARLLLPVLDSHDHAVNEPVKLAQITFHGLGSDAIKALQQCSHIRLVGLQQSLGEDDAEVITIVKPLGQVIVDEFNLRISHRESSFVESGSVSRRPE